MNFDPPKFESTLNLDVYLEWIQTLETFVNIKGYSDERAFKVAFLKLKKYVSLYYKTTKDKEPKS